MEKKNIRLILIGLVLIAIIVSVVMTITGSDNNTNIVQNSASTDELSDIYAKIPDFDVVLNKAGITQEQRENAIKNTRTFISLCEQAYTENDTSPDSRIYTVGRLAHNDNYTDPHASFCSMADNQAPAPPSYHGTYRYDENLRTLEYNEQGETSIYDTWEGDVQLEGSQNFYIQYIGF